MTSVALHTRSTMKVENMRKAKKRCAINQRRVKSSQAKGRVGINRLFRILSRIDSDQAMRLPRVKERSSPFELRFLRWEMPLLADAPAGTRGAVKKGSMMEHAKEMTA